ncbi:MAG: molecular chaperone TorD [Rhodospirillaceae bacterium]|nr:molecular chaperone TorD [Magnetovibrio sp.]MAY66491.1 molecular chaperone TorD [Rhodospirillaceae bacterium]
MGSSAKGERPLSDSDNKTNAPAVPEEDMQRAGIYALLSRLLAKPMDNDTIAFVRELTGDESPLGQAVDALATMAKRTTQAVAEEEYTVLFYGFGAGGELAPFGSQYLTGFIYEKPLADLRRDLAELGIARAEGVSDPEDHIAFVCEVMHGLITGAFGPPASLERQRAFFEAHLAPWAGHFFADMEKAKSAVVYMPLGTIGKLFMEIERDAFGFGQ